MPTPGPLELIIILVIALLVLGPGKLPDVGSALGKSIREFRKASSDVQEAVNVKVDTSPLPPTPVAPPQAAAPAPPADPVAQPAAPAVDAAPPVASTEFGRFPDRRPLAGRRRPTMADADAVLEPGIGDLSVPPFHAATCRSADRRHGHVAGRPSRRAAQPHLPLDHRRRRRGGHRVLLRHEHPDGPAGAAGRPPAPGPRGRVTRSSSRSRSRSSRASSWPCRSCSTSSGRSSVRG